MDPRVAGSMASHSWYQPDCSIRNNGSGSAILSVLAAKLVASHVFGVDIEDEAVDAGRENARLNGVASETVEGAQTMDALGLQAARGVRLVALADVYDARIAELEDMTAYAD